MAAHLALQCCLWRLLTALPSPPLQDRSDHEVEKIKSALVLCYGHVARCAPKELVLARIEADILRNIFLYFHTKVSPAPPCEEGGREEGGSPEEPSSPPPPATLTVFLLCFVQVLGIKVETKVQSKAPPPHLHFSVFSLCLSVFSLVIGRCLGSKEHEAVRLPPALLCLVAVLSQ